MFRRYTILLRRRFWFSCGKKRGGIFYIFFFLCILLAGDDSFWIPNAARDSSCVHERLSHRKSPPVIVFGLWCTIVTPCSRRTLRMPFYFVIILYYREDSECWRNNGFLFCRADAPIHCTRSIENINWQSNVTLLGREIRFVIGAKFIIFYNIRYYYYYYYLISW